MGTVGHNGARNNFFWSHGNLDNEAWDNALSVAATGRITQLTAYMAGDTGAMIGGPALWNSAGTLLLYTATSIARRSAPYSGGVDGSGRSGNDGYYVNVYGFNHTFTNPTSFIVGAFRRSIDTWILGFKSTDPNYGHLKTTGTSSPVAATGGSSWATESGFNGGVQAYATYNPLGMFARVGGVFVPVVGKRFHDSTTTYFATVMADSPIHYWRLDESAAPILDYGSFGMDLSVIGSPAYSQSALIVDPDTAINPVGSNAIYGDEAQHSGTTWGALDFTMEAWVKTTGTGPDHPGGGGHSNDIMHLVHWASADRYKTSISCTATDVTVLLGSADFSGVCNNDADQHTTPGVVSVGVTHHLVVTYTAGPNFAGDGNQIYGGACVPAAPGTAGIAKLYVDGVLVDTWDVPSFRVQITPATGDSSIYRWEIGTYYSDEYGLQPGGDLIIDEAAMYNTVLTPTQVAHHYAVGIGATGGTVSVAATYYVRNDANTAWIALNMAALRGWLPERREFRVREVWPDGRWRDLLGRWGEPETFGFEKGALSQHRSGLIVPRQFALA